MEPGRSSGRSTERERQDRFAPAIDVATRLLDNIETVVYGKREEVKLVVAALMCGGHVLLEDVPGTAKTVLARAIGGSMDGSMPSRIQCTPDLQPTDVTGISVFDQQTRDFEFRPGPIFANVVLVDEINRATPKTQSALLEAMAERQVTVDGVTQGAPDPFPPARDREPDRVRGHVPASGGAARPLLPPHRARLPRRRSRSSASCEEQRFGHPLAAAGAGGRPWRRCRSCGALRSTCTWTRCCTVDRGPRPCDARARRSRDRKLRARQPRSRARRSRLGARSNGRGYVVPDDIERLFVPVLVHRWCSRPPSSRRPGGRLGGGDRGVPRRLPRGRSAARLRRRIRFFEQPRSAG